ncbi:MAG TPA: malto-oligosyltrehalose synthase [Gemmataceae bacterium]|nr:malto-oligosyltrehalose synthase [Gemmataceae bacterium]
MQSIEDLLRKTADLVNARRRLPEATYRLQFHAGFTFRDAIRIVPYLRDLGITHIYASPYLKARPSSSHGYDITDHQLLNSEIGAEEDYAVYVKALRDHNLGQILDVVPNHMGIVGNENPWWNDVLENGRASPYSGYFDISWDASPRPELKGRVLIPILGDPYGKALESGQIRLQLQNGAFSIHYFEHRFPLDPRTFDIILRQRHEELAQLFEANDPALLEYQSILTAVGHLPSHSETTATQVAERQREKEVIKRRLQALFQATLPLAEFVNRLVVLFNGSVGDRRSFDLLDDLLDRQAYRLSFWRVASDEINYRRFFDVNELAALSMEREEVFVDTHKLVLRLLADGALDGLRIDHVDGLYDPQKYLQRLQQSYVLSLAKSIVTSDPSFQELAWETIELALREKIADAVREGQHGPLWRPLYVVVEKILGADESLPEDWSIHGTSGYDFLNYANGLFVNSRNATAFARIYQEWINDDTPFAEWAYQKKSLILHVSLASELQILAYQLDRLAQKNRWSRDYTLNSLRRAVREVIACFPVYRSYINDDGVRDTDRRYVEMAVRFAMTRNPTMSRFIYQFLRDSLLLKYPDTASDQDKAEQRHFAGKFQQVSSPVMAKGIEDTAFYTFNRFLSLNEVGGNAERFGLAPEALHRYFQERQSKWPYALSPLSTHDTKRSEDVRARLNVLSEMPDEWREAVTRWSQMNSRLRQTVDDVSVPDRNEEYFLYQTLIGAWPLEPYTPEDYAAFVSRIQAYMLKALHEAKVHSSWINPNPEYDDAVRTFASRILDETANADFINDFRAFQGRLSKLGLLNSLSQTLLKIVSPGVPDTYQGTELWDFSLVDPDNRRPVDFERRRHMLDELQLRAVTPSSELARELTNSMADGRIKLFVTWQALCCCRAHPGLFSTGAYEPVETSGAKRDHVFSFVRRQGDKEALVAVPRLVAGLAPNGDLLQAQYVWQDTNLVLPRGQSAQRYRNIFTGESFLPTVDNGRRTLALAQVFADFPVALFIAET